MLINILYFYYPDKIQINFLSIDLFKAQKRLIINGFARTNCW